MNGIEPPRETRETPQRPLFVDFSWELSPDDGGAMVTSYQFQWRYSGDAWSGKLFNQDSSCYTVEIADTSTSVQARVRARNSVGLGSWATTVTVAASSLLGLSLQRHWFTSSQTFS